LVTKKISLGFTDAAVIKLKEVLTEQEAVDQYLRVAVNETENGGVDYVFGLEKSPNKKDIVVDSEIKVLVDDKSAPLIDGSNIDYVEGFQRSGFVISNPNFPGGCACGNTGGCGCGGGGCGSSGGGGGCGSGGGGGGGCGCGGH
tara:strand:- start:1146 stop:1577 length:432 start_codon:yes stop_codon:yes gene_type:complete